MSCSERGKSNALFLFLWAAPSFTRTCNTSKTLDDIMRCQREYRFGYNLGIGIDTCRDGPARASRDQGCPMKNLEPPMTGFHNHQAGRGLVTAGRMPSPRVRHDRVAPPLSRPIPLPAYDRCGRVYPSRLGRSCILGSGARDLCRPDPHSCPASGCRLS